MTNYHFWRGEPIRLRAIEQKDFDAVTQDFGEYDTIVFGMTREEFDRLDPVAELWEDSRYQLNPVARG